MKTLLRSSLAAAGLALTASLGVVVAAPTVVQAAQAYEPVPAAIPSRPMVRTSCVWANAVRAHWTRPRSSTMVLGYEVAAFDSRNRRVSGRAVGAFSWQTDLTGLRLSYTRAELRRAVELVEQESDDIG